MQTVYQSIRKTGTLGLLDFEDMSLSYAQTLKLWRVNFNKHLSRVKALGFDDEFIRKWNYYFSYCEAAFGMRNISIAQVVLTRSNNYLLV